MDDPGPNIEYSDSSREYTETTTSPFAAIVREEELSDSGYTVKHPTGG